MMTGVPMKEPSTVPLEGTAHRKAADSQNPFPVEGQCASVFLGVLSQHYLATAKPSKAVDGSFIGT